MTEFSPIVATTQAQHQARIDVLMEQASHALVARKYFEVEELCVEALRRAQAASDFDRVARVALPLQEARRQKRDLAFDAAVEDKAVFVVDGEVPTGKALVPGCYLVAPPRVGVDGRVLREAADAKRVPIIVVVREPRSRDGMWPIVTVGPVTVRTKVAPPLPPPPPKPSGRGKKTTKNVKHQSPVAPGGNPAVAALDTPPDPKWFLTANEALGDAAITACLLRPTAFSQAESLIDHLAAQPDHEKLHQALEEAARRAAREPISARRVAMNQADFEKEEDEDAA